MPVADLVPSDNTTQSLPGTIGGWINLLVPKADEPRRGGFYLAMDNTRLGELPLFAQFMHVINLTLPKPGAFNMARIKGDIMPEKLRLETVVLQGSALSLTGAGYAWGGLIPDPAPPDQKKSGLDLVFVVDTPRYLPSVPIVSSLYEAIRPQLVQFRVTGTLTKPQVTPAAFPSLSEALFQLERPQP